MISRALLETFPELPSVAKQLSEDVDVLETLADEARSVELMEPLVGTVGVIHAKIAAFDDDVVMSGFGPMAHGLSKNLYDIFEDVAAKSAGTEFADMPWMVVRGLAIDLNNKHDALEGACAILEGLVTHQGTTPSTAVAQRLNNDRRTLRRNLKWEELKRVSGDVRKGVALIPGLLDDADEDERAILHQIKTALEKKRAATVRKRVLWGLAAAAFIGFLIYSVNKKPSYSTLTPSSEYEEQKPSPGTDRLLNRSEVRYCIFQGERLDILRELITNNAEVDQFNILISDINSRCSSSRYRQDVLRAIETELSGRQSQFKHDAQQILVSWRVLSSSPTMDNNLINVYTVSGTTIVQSRLKQLGYYSGPVDGIWGSMSRNALRNFKLSRSGLTNDDSWDLATQNALMGVDRNNDEQ